MRVMIPRGKRWKKALLTEANRSSETVKNLAPLIVIAF